MTDVAGSPRHTATSVVLILLVVLAFAALVGWSISAVRKPKDHWDDVHLAQRYLDQGRPDLAIQIVSTIRDEAPGAAEALTIAARALIARNAIPLARRALERSLALNPKQPDAAKMLAAIYLASGDGPRGLALLKQATELDPSDFGPWYAMGKVQHDMGNLAESAEAYAEALKRHPREPEATESRLGRIRALLDASRAEEATADVEEARERTPRDPRLLGLAARHAADLGRRDEARDLAEQALAADPDTFDALLVRGRVRYLAGQAAEARDDLERATRINPNHLGALQLLVQVQARLGLKDESARTQERFRRASERLALMDRLTKQITQNPNDPEPRWRMGQAALEGGMNDLAIQCFQATLDVDPNFKPAREALDQLRAKGSSPDAAPGPSGVLR
jgi:tetratricopeptide (TPR) repeat protein